MDYIYLLPHFFAAYLIGWGFGYLILVIKRFVEFI